MVERAEQRIAEKVSQLRSAIIEMRRTICMYPELSGDERRTSQLVAEKLRAYGLEVQTQIGGYGVVGLLTGGQPGAIIAWRADMDACAMQDTIDTPYTSRIDGVKHVCGHDAHTAIALGIAETLTSVKDDLHGTIKFIFQPYEEGTQGAARMIADGVLEHPRPRAVYGLHVTNWGIDQTYLQAGQLSINYGAALFGKQVFTVIVNVTRENIILPVEQEVLIHYLKRLNRYQIRCEKASQNIVDLNILEKDTVFRKNEIHVKASFRCAQRKYADEINEELHRIMNAYQENNHYDVRIKPVTYMPPVYNDEQEAEEAYRMLQQHIGDHAVAIRHEFPPHGTDDFALFQHEIGRGLFFFLGIANIAKGITVGMHHPNFDIDEECLEVGVRTMALFLFEVLRKT